MKRRAEELDAAQIQRAARDAALRGDWKTVDRLLVRVEKLGADNEWVGEVAVELRELAARRDEAMFAKESMYASRRMASRLASRDELGESISTPVQAFVRRKSAQGKRDPRTPR